MFRSSLVCTGKWNVLGCIFFCHRGPWKNMRLPSVDGKTELVQQSEYKLRNMWGMVHLFGQNAQSCLTNVSWQWIYLCYTLHSEKCQAWFCWSFTFAQVTRRSIILLRLSKRTHCRGCKHCMICVGRKLALLELAPWQDGLSQFIRYSVTALDK